MKISILLFLLLTTASLTSFAQISSGGIPVSWQEVIPETSLKTIILEPVKIPKGGNIEKHGSFAFAKVIKIDKSINEIGEWVTLDSGDRLWRTKIKSKGAHSLSLIFSEYLIPEGAEVYIYSSDKKYKIGAFNHKNNKTYGSLAVSSIPSDEIIIEYYEPKSVDFNGELTIGSIGHDYLNIFGNKDGQFGNSGECNIDINCSEGAEWQIHKRSICRMTITSGSSVYLCTGSLVNNAAENKLPYILSANHCVNTQDLANNTVFIFNYESPNCGGSDGSISQSISGADLIATKNRDNGYLDFTLLKLSSDVPLAYKPYFAGWNSSGSIPEKTTCIHHPWGDVKKISQDFDASEMASYASWGYDDDSFWKINHWDNGTTEGGSSGSPIFNQNKQIVGTLTGGEASCNIDSCDYFQMFSLSYDKYSLDSLQLKHWLDPLNTGINSINGLDTYSEDRDVSNVERIQHWEDNQELALYTANEGGYLAGNNIYKDKAKAEFFNINEFNSRNAITGAFVAFGFAKGRDTELIELQVLKDNSGAPSSVIGSTSVSLKLIKEKADKDYTYYQFNPPISINSSIYLSIVLPQYEGDTIALMTTEESKVNTAWELSYNNEWLPYSSDNSWNVNLSHLIALEIGNFTSINTKNIIKSNINIYPNPAIDLLNINLGVGISKQAVINIYDSFGRLLLTNHYSHINDKIEINISNLQEGLYIVSINLDGNIIAKKIVKK